MNKKNTLDKNLNVLVALDLTEMDAALLRYISFLNSIFSIQHIYFAHNIKQSVLHKLYEDFISEDIQIDQIIEDELKRSIAKNYTGQAPYSTVVTNEIYTESALTDLTKEHAIDVVVAGDKTELKGTGGLPQKLVRMLNTHLLLVPEESRLELNKILAPTDFSGNSIQAVQASLLIAGQTKGEVEALHVFGIPSFYFPYIDREKAEEKTKKHLHSRFVELQKKHALPADTTFKYVDKKEYSVVEAIQRESERGRFDMIVISARGANNLTRLFIGSTTNDLIQSNQTMPILVIK